jgi:hypothetical protein
MTRSLAISIVSLALCSCVIHHHEAPAPTQATAETPVDAPSNNKKKKGKKKKKQQDASEAKQANAAKEDVKVVHVKRRDAFAPKRTTPDVSPDPVPEPVPVPEPSIVPAGKKGKRKKAGTGVRVACNFEQGFVAVLPVGLYDPGEEFLMQALIGLTEEPTFWKGLPEYAKLEPYKASRCTSGGQTFALAPGKYKVAVGQAGQFSVRNEYRDNGFLSEIEVVDGTMQQVKLSTTDLKHTWLCISCPWLVVFQDGQRVEAGQVLVDRYTRKRYGTDVVTTQADVVDGVLVVRLEEREPEVSFIDAVVVRAGGDELRPMRRTPKAVRAIDDAATELRLGEAIELRFDARGHEDGPIEVEIEVSGHYEPIGPLL